MENVTLSMCVYTRARTNVATFEYSFLLATFVSKLFATKHSLIIQILCKCAINSTDS